MTVPPGISIAFGADALADNPTWTRIDNAAGIKVTSVVVERGRGDERSKTVPGTVTVTGYDLDGNLDPTNSSGLWAGMLDPTLQAAVTLWNPVTNAWNYIFRGHTAEFIYELDVSEKFATFELDFVDLLDLLNDAEVIPDGAGNFAPNESVGDCYYTGQHCDDRQLAVLADTSSSFLGSIWPTDMLEIASGNVYVQGVAYGRHTSMLQVIDEACDAEGPSSTNRYAAKDGPYRFAGRYYRYTPDLFLAADDASRGPNHRMVKWGVGDLPAFELDSTLAVASKLKVQRGKANLINTALCTPQGIPTSKIGAQAVHDATSVAKYGVRTGGMSLENLKIAAGDDGQDYIHEAKSYGQVIVNNYKNPVNRVPQMVFRNPPKGDANRLANTWALMTGIELSDLVTVHSHHPGGGGFAGVDHYVEKIHYDISALQGDEWNVTLTLDLSPRAYYADTSGTGWSVPTGSGLQASYTYVQSGGAGSPIAVFTDTSQTDGVHPITQWVWDYGDGSTDTFTVATSPSHTYASTGLWSATLTVTDSASHISKTIQSVILV